MPLLTPSEKQDYARAIANNGYDNAEFQLRETSRDVQQGNLTITAGTVTINRGARSKTYRAGHGTAWIADFVRDLKAGAFGPPPS